jgi:hypothetical protein
MFNATILVAKTRRKQQRIACKVVLFPSCVNQFIKFCKVFPLTEIVNEWMKLRGSFQNYRHSDIRRNEGVAVSKLRCKFNLEFMVG